MEMHQVRYFLAVCEALNFTRAAEACSVAQPSLTKAIKKLEDELGGELFRRERNQTHLTDLGNLMKPHIEAIFSASEAAKADADGFKSQDQASIKLGVMSTIGPSQMVGFIARLRDEIPQLELTIREAPGRDLVTALIDGEIEAGLVGLPELPDRLHALPLYRERYTVAFAKGHPFEQLNAVPVNALHERDYLKRVHCEFSDHFEALGAVKQFQVNVRYASEREDWIQAMVLAGMGCCIMPEFLPVLQGIASRPVIEPEVSRTISLVTAAGRPHSAALSAMTRLAKRYRWPAMAAG
jgi:DNA-binding transcriptional LysR family regulator